MDGTSYNDTYILQNDFVNAANLSCYIHRVEHGIHCLPIDYEDPRQQEELQALAHAYGDGFFDIDVGYYNTTDDIINSKYEYQYFVRSTPEDFTANKPLWPTPPEFAYRFNEYNPTDSRRVYASHSNRIITASSGECFEYNQTNATRVPDLNNIIDVSLV